MCKWNGSSLNAYHYMKAKKFFLKRHYKIQIRDTSIYNDKISNLKKNYYESLKFFQIFKLVLKSGACLKNTCNYSVSHIDLEIQRSKSFGN